MISKLNIRKTISPSLNARDWQLYSSSPKRESVAKELNLWLRVMVNGGQTRRETEKKMVEIMRTHADVGAYDSEPCGLLDEILDVIYGDPQQNE